MSVTLLDDGNERLSWQGNWRAQSESYFQGGSSECTWL